MKKLLLLSLALFWTIVIYCQSSAVMKIRSYRSGHEKEIIDEFVSFLAVPNIAADTINLHKNAEVIMKMMKARGIANVQLLTPSTTGAAPAVYGEVKVQGATQTLI